MPTPQQAKRPRYLTQLCGPLQKRNISVTRKEYAPAIIFSKVTKLS